MEIKDLSLTRKVHAQLMFNIRLEGIMDRREAFRAAVIKFVPPEWAFPDNDTFGVEGKYRTIREVCEGVKDDDQVLPDPTVRDLIWAMHGDLRLIEKLGQSRTYATGSRCLLDLLNDRVANF